jgi:outer membrane receptor protein involved in Fe transport
MKTPIILTISLFLLSATLVSAQHRFSVGITAAPTYAYSNTTQTIYLPALYVPGTPSGSTDPVPFISSGKISSTGYLAGAMLQYQFTPNWSVSTGLWYNYSSTKRIDLIFPGDIPNRITSHSLQIPLLINYRSSQKRLSPYFSVGSLANLSQHTSIQYASSSGVGDINFISGKSIAYRAMLGAGIAYRLNQHLSLFAQPMLIWNVKPSGTYSHYVSYQINGQMQLLYSF